MLPSNDSLRFSQISPIPLPLLLFSANPGVISPMLRRSEVRSFLIIRMNSLKVGIIASLLKKDKLNFKKCNLNFLKSQRMTDI